MNRMMILAAAAALVALPASAQSIHISTVGKSPQQVRDEVFTAARTLCARETVGVTFYIEEMRACIESTTRQTFAHADAKLKLARR